MNPENIFLYDDDAIIEAALEAFEGHRHYPDSPPRCEEEDTEQSARVVDFFLYWLREEVSDFYPEGMTDSEDDRAEFLALEFECAVFEAVRFERDVRLTLAGLPR